MGGYNSGNMVERNPTKHVSEAAFGRVGLILAGAIIPAETVLSGVQCLKKTCSGA